MAERCAVIGVGQTQHTAKLTLEERMARHCRQFDPACEPVPSVRG